MKLEEACRYLQSLGLQCVQEAGSLSGGLTIEHLGEYSAYGEPFFVRPADCGWHVSAPGLLSRKLCDSLEEATQAVEEGYRHAFPQRLQGRPISKPPDQ